MEEACAKAGTFLEALFQGTGLNISVTVTETPAECLLDLSGADAGLLQVGVWQNAPGRAATRLRRRRISCNS